MKTLVLLPALLFSMIAVAPALRAETAAPADPAQRELKVVVVEALSRRPSRSSIYDRIAYLFPKEFERRQWPVKTTVERFGANTPDYETELKVVLQRIRTDLPDELSFRAWMTLRDHGTSHDFGIVKVTYMPRAAQLTDDVLDELIRRAAAAAADKIEPILFPKEPAVK